MIYLVGLAATTLLLWMSGKCRGTPNFVLVVIGLAVPCFIAGVRDETVGTDVLTYAKWMFLDAQSMGFAEFLQAESEIAAVGWNIFTWLSVRLMGTLAGYLFCIAALCIVPVYLGLRRASRGNEWVGMLLWLLLEFTFTLNGMRQSAAMGFVFYAVNYIFERKPWRFVFWVAVGMLFHQTAIIGLLLYPLARMGAISSGFKMFFGRWSGWALGCIIAACAAAAFALGPRIVVLASAFKDSYRYQVNHLGENDFSVAGAYLMVGVALIWLLMRRDFADGKVDVYGVALSERFSVICLLSVVGCLAWQLNMVSGTLGRVGYYGTALIPYLGGVLAANGTRSRGQLWLLALFLLVYFVVMTLALGKAGAWPYTSQILGIS